MCYRLVIPESPRWLLCKGRTAEVAAIIRKACAVNKREVPANFEKVLKTSPPSSDDNEEGCISLFGTPYLRLITICFLCIWFTMNLVYYGLILNMNKFGGNVYFNSVSTLHCFDSFVGVSDREIRFDDFGTEFFACTAHSLRTVNCGGRTMATTVRRMFIVLRSNNYFFLSFILMSTGTNVRLLWVDIQAKIIVAYELWVRGLFLFRSW